MRTNITDVGGLFADISDTAWGVNAGGGLRVGGPAFGVRGDLRYFRQLSDVEFGDVDVDFGDFCPGAGPWGCRSGSNLLLGTVPFLLLTCSSHVAQRLPSVGNNCDVRSRPRRKICQRVAPFKRVG